MGFNKRFLKKENILNHLDNIMNYLDADAVMCTDDFSRNVYRMFNQGKTKEQIIQYINKNK
jgi:DNA-binding CsgD family transcriptional regulator